MAKYRRIVARLVGDADDFMICFLPLSSMYKNLCLQWLALRSSTTVVFWKPAHRAIENNSEKAAFSQQNQRHQ